MKGIFQEQSRRRQRIDKVCQEHGSQLYHENLNFQHFLIFIPQYNLLFCGIPKAGTTTWVVGRDQHGMSSIFTSFCYSRVIGMTRMNIITFLTFKIFCWRSQNLYSKCWFLCKGIFQKLAAKLGVPKYKFEAQRGEFLKHFKIKDKNMLNRILEGNPVAFTNVRHPFERLVSGYLDAVPGGKFKELRGQSFQQFVEKTVLK